VSALPPGFRYLEGWIPAAEAGALLPRLVDGIDWEQPRVRFGGRELPTPRLVAFYGPHDYSYSGIVHAARTLPAEVEALRGRLVAETGHPFNCVLMNLYRDGTDSVSWHSDDDYPHGGAPAVASVSLGATRRFRIAPKRGGGASVGVDLASGSLLLMEGRSQLDYRHALPKTATAAGVRVNLTFRCMATSNRGGAR
jgi:alkylated DNA repair dioxygenase AlkB